MSPNQRIRLSPSPSSSLSPTPNPPDSEPEPGILNERILLLVFGSMKWDLPTLCATARVNRKLRAVAKRILWRELCIYRAPRMVAALIHGLPGSRIGGGWHALAKLLFFCCGCQSTPHFRVDQPLLGHFVKASRFSKTSGRSFLSKKHCKADLLYVSDPCEHHALKEGEDDVGVYRGVFRGFMRSKMRACLIGKQIELEERVRCPYCGARVWSMTAAKLIPKTAARRLGTHQGGLEYFVCINGHLHGTCWLVPLSDDDEEVDEEEDEEEEVDEEEEDMDDGGGNGGVDFGGGSVVQKGGFGGYESTTSTREDIVIRDSNSH